MRSHELDMLYLLKALVKRYFMVITACITIMSLVVLSAHLSNLEINHRKVLGMDLSVSELSFRFLVMDYVFLELLQQDCNS